MIQHRCPWCGEKIPFHLPIKGLWSLGNPEVCPKCKKPYTSNTGRNSAIILVFGVIGAYIAAFFIKKFNHGILNWILGIAGLMLLAIVFAELCRIPYARYIRKEERPWIGRKRSAEIHLSWEKHGREGLFLPRFRVLDGEIFPACFMDTDGASISTAFCVVLTEPSLVGQGSLRL